MVDCMTKVAEQSRGAFNVEERNMFALANKFKVDARRKSWKSISSILQDSEYYKLDEQKLEMTKDYLSKIEGDLFNICLDALQVIDKHLILGAIDCESKAFFYKLKGDYHRYIAEFATGIVREKAVQHGLIAYTTASDIANAELPAAHPVRLSVGNNFAVFIHDILGSRERAFDLAMSTIRSYIFADDTIQLLNSSDMKYRKTMPITRLLKKNIKLWQPAPSANATPEGEEQPNQNNERLKRT